MSFTVLGLVAEAIVFVLATVGLPGLFALEIVESFGVPPIPSEVILPFAGYLVAQGTFPFYGALAAAVAGEVIGAFVAYAVGRWWRHHLERIGVGPFRLRPQHLDAMDRFFARRGELTVAVARLVPVARSYISYPAGASAMSPARFGAYTALGTTPFVAVFLYAGIVLRSHWNVVEAVFYWFDYAILGLVVLGGVYLYLLLTDRVAPGWPPRRRPPERPAEG